MPPWSSGLGHCPLTAATGVRIPLGVPNKKPLTKAVFLFQYYAGGFEPHTISYTKNLTLLNKNSIIK